ncbi:type VI secretion system protein TssA [Noviherbaspirillum cavernae]|uniref:Type VI secretion system protein TssA n=1 Tax=Noviherbaspirillum cavernae TaxID=2320862 RepID=A0A418X131_9BURK|nr:type VI secretion system protein TssA [Noviherbaspirillum cavernae]RJG06133.1 type VI secretion system protein TssA [Noviherbaspirillum cavernae]
MKMEKIPDGILMPLSPEQPCGEDMSFSPEFDRIQEARREDDPTVDYGEWQTTLKQADWPMVVECCAELLKKRSKDLRLSAWLAEGMIKTSGLSGLALGMEIMSQLLATFGNDMHPQAEAGDQERRIGNLSWFVTRMAALVRQTPITDAKPGSFSLNDYESARLLQTQLQRDPEAISDIESRITLEKFSSAVQKTGKTRYVQWNADVERCIAALKQLTQSSDALFGMEGPSFTSLSESLDAVRFRLQTIGKEVGILAPVTVLERGASGGETDAGPVFPVQNAISGGVRNRAQALALLREVAIFFRNTEPHSPVAYLADKAAHWGSMPLHSWLRSVVKDQGTLSNIEEMLGLDMDTSGEKS